MPDYSINRDISFQGLESDAELIFEASPGFDSSHPSRDFGDLTAIINEQNKSKETKKILHLTQKRLDLKSVVSFGNLNVISIPGNSDSVHRA
jgi:hypothetical protein